MSNNNLPVGVIKEVPDEFIVKEVVRDPLDPTEPPREISFCEETIIQGWDGANTTVFSLSKRGWNTENAMNAIARGFRIHLKRISYHGIKDKWARTSQLIGVQGNFSPEFSPPNGINLVQLYSEDEALRQGGHWRNRFDILVRSKATQLDLSAVEVVPNRWGTQRLKHDGSEQVGRLLLEGENEEAIMLMLKNPCSEEKILKAKELSNGSWDDALRHGSFEFSYKFEIHKWQSHLWNLLLEEELDKFGDKIPDWLPMWNLNPDVLARYRHLWNPSYSQLDQRALSFLAPTSRQTIVRPERFTAEREEMGWRCKFDLIPAAYATEVIARMFDVKERPHRRSR